MEKNPTNNVHLNGYMNAVVAMNDKSAIINMATREFYNGENHYTYHNVSVALDKKSAKTLAGIKADLEANLENRGNADFKPKRHTMSVDGALVIREREADDVKYYNPTIVARDFKFDAELGKDEVRNFGEFKGNIASINMGEKYASVSIATHYFAPSENADEKYTEKTTFVRVTVNGDRTKEIFDQLKSGELAVGDLITARGQLHNDNYTDKDGVSRRNVRVDVSKVELNAKKKVAESQETKKEAKKEAKAAPAKKDTSRRKI